MGAGKKRASTKMSKKKSKKQKKLAKERKGKGGNKYERFSKIK